MTELEKAARQALDAMGLVGADLVCGASSHHRRTDLHGDEDVCPIRSRWHDAFAELSRALAQQAKPVPEPEHWVVTTKVGDIVGFRAPGLKKGDRVYLHPQQQAEPVKGENK